MQEVLIMGDMGKSQGQDDADDEFYHQPRYFVG